MWNKVKNGDIPFNVEVIGHSREWIDVDFNLEGVRVCFINGNGTWISSKWLDYQDTYINDEETVPEIWMHLPTIPINELDIKLNSNKTKFKKIFE